MGTQSNYSELQKAAFEFIAEHHPSEFVMLTGVYKGDKVAVLTLVQDTVRPLGIIFNEEMLEQLKDVEGNPMFQRTTDEDITEE